MDFGSVKLDCCVEQATAMMRMTGRIDEDWWSIQYKCITAVYVDVPWLVRLSISVLFFQRWLLLEEEHYLPNHPTNNATWRKDNSRSTSVALNCMSASCNGLACSVSKRAIPGDIWIPACTSLTAIASNRIASHRKTSSEVTSSTSLLVYYRS